jgi:hypothetical protein
MVRRATMGTNGTASARTKRPAVGSTVKVRFGIGLKRATVLEYANGRVRVAIHMSGVDEPIVNTYALGELQPA